MPTLVGVVDGHDSIIESPFTDRPEKVQVFYMRRFFYKRFKPLVYWFLILVL
jgi:hypothetical protein